MSAIIASIVGLGRYLRRIFDIFEQRSRFMQLYIIANNYIVQPKKIGNDG
jgi:hypothetical protein